MRSASCLSCWLHTIAALTFSVSNTLRPKSLSLFVCVRLQDVIAPIAELSPEFAVQALVLELLQSEVPDCVLAGLKALQVRRFVARGARGGGHVVTCCG